MNSDMPAHFLDNQNPHPYVWIGDGNLTSSTPQTPTKIQTRQWAQNLLDQFKDGFQWKDLVEIMSISDQFLTDFSTMTLDEKRNSTIQILNDFIDITDTPFLPDEYTDPIFKAMVPFFVNMMISDDTVHYTPVFENPSRASIQETARDVLSSFKDGVHWQDLAEVSKFALQFAERHRDITENDKAGIAKEIVDFVIDETDTPYLIDPVSDPIFKQIIHPIIDAYFHITSQSLLSK